MNAPTLSGRTFVQGSAREMVAPLTTGISRGPEDPEDPAGPRR